MQLYILVSDPDVSAIFITGCDKNGGWVWFRDSQLCNLQVSELLLLSRQVISGQEKLSEQVSDVQERLCTVESGLSRLPSS